jgi:P4 family phage/plasmid primase-like protien
MPVQIYRLKAGEKTFTHALTKDGLKSFRAATKNIDALKVHIEHDFISEDHAPYNVYCTLAEYTSAKRKSKAEFSRQTVMGFDIDKIDVPRMSEYPAVIAQALLLDVEKCFVVCSGGGIHFVFEPEDFVFPNISYFDKYMPYYKGWSNEINKALREAGLLGVSDLDFFKPGVMVRWPGTLNIKPVETAPLKFETKRDVILLKGHLEPQVWGITDIAPIAVEKKDEGLTRGQYGTPDAKEIQKECLFLRYSKENAEKLTEPQWFKMLNLLGHIDETRELAHAYSAEDKKRYTKEETDTKIDSSTSFCGPFTCDSVSKVWDGCKTCPHFGKIRSPITLKSKDHVATKDCGFTKYSAKGAILRQHEDLRKFFEEKHPYIMLRSVGSLYLFNGKYYEHSSSDFVKGFAQEHFNPICEKNSEREEFWGIVKSNNGREANFFDTPESLINLENGVLNVETGELHAHSKEFGFLYCLDYGYDPKATCPTWDLLMKNLTGNKQHMIDVLEEFLGYMVSGMEYRYNRILVLAGDGNNGKTTVLNCMKKIIGEKNFSAVSAKKFPDRFTPVAFYGKLANFAEEASKEAFKETDVIKALTGDSDLEVERKFENSFKFRNRAKLVMTYNEVPYLSDRSEGMMRRLLIMPFDVNLTEEKDKLIPDVYKKIQLELPGILNRALAGLARLKANDGFTDVPETREKVKEMHTISDPVFAMWEALFETTGNKEDCVTIPEMWTQYEKFDPREGNFQRISQLSFSRRIAGFIKRNKNIEFKQKRIDGNLRVNALYGVRQKQFLDNQDY